MSTSKFRIFKVLLLAGATWLFMIIFLYMNWESLMEQQKQSMKFSKNPRDDFSTKYKQKQSEYSMEVVKQFVDNIYEEQKKIVELKKARKVSTISPDIYKRLGLSNNAGEGGKGIHLLSIPPDIQKIINDGWQRHEFNELVSELIALNRSVPDPRSSYCKRDMYSHELPKTSVIIIFHNEAWSTLLRTVHSVLNRSPEHLIEEILLVDDYSNMEHLGEPLEEYILDYPKVKILRTEKRVGLIKARIHGTLAAKSQTLTFLDSHVECAEGWLEPLLDRISKDTRNVVAPVIDVIDDNTFEFSYQDDFGLQVGGFDWEMTFDWHPVPLRERQRKTHPSDPTKTPTIAGGLFSIDKDFFTQLGMYDPGFDIWGGENLELSFKTWMCGGTLEIIPCSHVGHVFRKKSPYKWRPGVDVIKSNLIRLVEVWLDEYGKYYYLRRGFDKGDFGDISDRVKLRNDLKCKSFKWYLENVFPEMKVPDNLAEGWIKNLGISNRTCLDLTIQENEPKSKLETYHCHYTGGNQFFEYTSNFELSRNSRCLEFDKDASELIFYPCHNQKGNQEWMYDLKTKQIIHKLTNMCLATSDHHPYTILIAECDVNNDNQKFIFQYVYEDKFNIRK